MKDESQNKKPGLKKILGNNLKRYREQQHIDQKDLAIAADIVPEYYSRIENGKANTTVAVIEKFAKKLKVDPMDLFKEEN